jgi:hypothetical protein
VAGAVHPMRGRLGTHMSVWVPMRDSVVRSWGYCLHGHDSESYGVTHLVASEAAVELEARSKARFICIILVLADDSREPLDPSG